MFDPVNLFIEQQKIKDKQLNLEISSNNLTNKLIEKLDIMIDILNEIKEKQFNTSIVSHSNNQSKNNTEIKEISKPFIPTINIKDSNIPSNELQKRTRKIDLNSSK